MGERGPKPQFINVACPNRDCKLYGLNDQGNVIGNGTYISRGEKTRRYLCHHCGKAFCDHTDIFYHDLHKDEHTIDLALKMSMKGMSIEAIADVLEIQSASVK
jgi:transposase-like protein